MLSIKDFTLSTRALYSCSNIVHPCICFGRLPAILRGSKTYYRLYIDYKSLYILLE